ncbi:conserved membrane hypothetical protein [Rubrivivax sp. A210]|uniref:hypothetical protein n=1 Tax=Rubrivivax sp. A210 TaxID=2772301 RepID=UPI00191A7535|nr:hypothetical protein [Rubrivivax sp. A210]CAD5371303.1 conserved membrane hypothetical protein [Rubrivivax sp. A210]
MSTGVLSWWLFLCGASLLNVLAWTASVAALRRRASSIPPQTWLLLRLQLLLSAGYVLGCAYRSVFPVFDVQRLCLVDSWLSSVIVGRTVATIAELCFAAQWALLLQTLAKATDSPSALRVSRAVVPMIAVAELCSWNAVLTTSNLGHVIEESLWGLCAALLVVSFAQLWPGCRREARPLLAATCTIGLAYVAYMFLVDVPMYWARWVTDTEQGRPVLSLAQGLVDASQRWVVSHRWADWETEVVWMSLYFSVAVWLSIGLVHATGRLGSAFEPRLTFAGSRAQASMATTRVHDQ